MKQYDLERAFPKTTEGFHNRVVDTLQNLPEEKERMIFMKKGMKKKWTMGKAAACVAVAVLACGTTVFAASKIDTWVMSGSPKPVYEEFPTAEQVENDYGFTPKAVEAFSNGFTFEEITQSKGEALDDAGNSLGEKIDLDYAYVKGDQEVTLAVSNKALSQEDETAELAEEYQGISLYYTNQAYKFVPEDYEMTEQDKEDEASGKYLFSYGSDEVEISQFVAVNWVDDGHEYILYGSDLDLSKDELLGMCKEVIDVK